MVKSTAMAYFKCSSLEGVKLEATTNALGDHWDNDILGNEVMTLSDDLHKEYSVFTLALLEDTGWY